jgi:hypothetical protein
VGTATDPAHAGRHHAEPASRRALRMAGAALVVAMGAIHLYLWLTGYRDVPVIGLLFVLNAVGSGVLAAGLVAVPAHRIRAVAGLAAVFTAGTLGALVLSVTVGLFGFRESFAGALVFVTIVVEAAGCVCLAVLAARPISTPEAAR